jgi:hypothetical protein
MYRIRRFGVVRTSNVFAILYLVITLIFVIPFALILASGPVTTTDAFGNTTQVNISPVFLLFIPLIYAGIGWIFTAIFCLIYNLASRFTGGIEVEVEGGPTPAAAAMPYPPA